MKKILFFALAMLAMNAVSHAQVDVQINPIGILFSNLDLTAEFGVSNDFGVETGLGYNFQSFDVEGGGYRNNAVGIRALGKYYFNPEDGIDRWAIGGYLRYGAGTATLKDNSSSSREKIKNVKLALGFYTGYKWVSRKNIVFELGLGIGRNLVRTFEDENGNTVDTSDIPLLNVDILGRLSLGYRFGGSKK